MADDEDLEQDSEAYRRWRSGNDNEKYASSKTPTETGSRSGSYTIPKTDNEYALPGEEDNSGGGSWLDGDMNWPVMIALFVVFALVIASVFAFAMTSNESETKGSPSEWPNTEGAIIEQDNVNTFITEEYCEDENGDEFFDDWECYKEFVYQVDLKYNYTIEEKTYVLSESVEFWESEAVDVLKKQGEDKLFQEFINATDERVSLNSTVKITYNPDKYEEAYSEFVSLPEDPLGFIGYFLMCCGGMLCIPIVIGGIIMSWAQRAAGMEGYGNRRGWGPFGGYFGGNHRGGGRNRRAKRRSGGTSRSGGGGRSGSGGRRR